MTPTTENELAEILAGAAGPLSVQGGGTRPIGHAVDGDVLSTSSLSGITLYEPGALTMVAQAGTPVAEIEAALADEKQMLAFEPMGNVTLIHITDIHAQLKPVWFREPEINRPGDTASTYALIGIGGLKVIQPAVRVVLVEQEPELGA